MIDGVVELYVPTLLFNEERKKEERKRTESGQGLGEIYDGGDAQSAPRLHIPINTQVFLVHHQKI